MCGSHTSRAWRATWRGRVSASGFSRWWPREGGSWVALAYSADLGIFSRVRDDLTLRTRKAVFHLFMRECAPGPESRVADFGVSGHRSHPAHYFFEALYPHRSRLTAIGRESERAGWLPDEFPGLQYLEADLRAIPLPDL